MTRGAGLNGPPPAPVPLSPRPPAQTSRVGAAAAPRPVLYTQSSPSDDTWTMFVKPMAGSGRPAVMTTRAPGS